MHKDKITTKTKITLATTLFIVAIISLCAIFITTNTASAKEGSYTYHGLTISGDKTPEKNIDFVENYIADPPTYEITIKTEGWTLSGTAGEAEDPPLVIYLNCKTIALSGLKINKAGSELTLLQACEISLVGNDDCYFEYAMFDYNVTLIGPKKLHVYNGNCRAEKNLTLINTTLESWFNSNSLNKASYPQLEVGSDGEGDLIAINSKIVTSVWTNVEDGKGLALHNNISLDENSELFAAGNRAAIYYDKAGVLNNALGCEEYLEEYKDKDKANKATTETLLEDAESPYYTKTIGGLNGIAKTIYVKGNASPTPPEPVTPTQEVTTTAQTGDSNVWIVLTLLGVIAAGLTAFIISRGRSRDLFI